MTAGGRWPVRGAGNLRASITLHRVAAEGR